MSPLQDTSEQPKTPTGVLHRGIQRRVARRVHSFCEGHQPRGSAQRAKITPRCDADARAQHVEDTVSDVGLGAQKRARRGGRWNDVLSEEYVGSRQVSSEPIW
jgi:hypothetical protein